jgi:hypothetical protein
METGVNTALSLNPTSSLNATLATTVANLYSGLSEQFTVLTDQATNGETAILQDWGRLQEVGPLTELTGYNGLGISANQLQSLEQQAQKGYELTVMQRLMAVSPYYVNLSVATTYSSASGYDSWDQYAYSTFGSNTGNYNQGYLYNPNHPTDYPSQTVMQTDIIDNGANLFELFNGINGWSPLNLTLGNVICYGTVLTLFNATPTDFSVTVTPQQGVLAAPGYNFNAHGAETGSESAATFELRPYGYLPIFAASNGPGNRNLAMNVTLSTASSVASFTFGSDGCNGDSLNVWNVSTSNGYSFSPSTFNLASSGESVGAPGFLEIRETQ